MLENNKNHEISESIIFSVSEVTLHIKQVIETQIEALYITGEISNFIKHGSGHIYFNLKDDNAVIRCAFFKNQNFTLDFLPQDGDQVVCFGRITVFEKSGQYQLIVNNMFPYGKGALQQRFEQLKLKLKTEGLFATEHKKPIPKYPDTIGIITSPTGAALQDILNILQRRYPCKVKVFPALMQGNEAAKQVISGLNYFNSMKDVDLIVIARGGGSQEDLFCFNDEQLARSIYASELPVVSAIGHEIDFTIADFVADLRAPTPSAAAELITPNSDDLKVILDRFQREFKSEIGDWINKLNRKVHVHQLKIMHNNPEKGWQRLQQRYDNIVSALAKLPEVVAVYQQKIEQANLNLSKGFLAQSRHLLQYQQHRIELSLLKFQHNLETQLQRRKHRYELSSIALDELSPIKVLNRGYSFVRKQGRIIKSVKSINQKDELELVLSDGTAKVSVEETNSGKLL